MCWKVCGQVGTLGFGLDAVAALLWPLDQTGYPPSALLSCPRCDPVPWDGNHACHNTAALCLSSPRRPAVKGELPLQLESWGPLTSPPRQGLYPAPESMPGPRDARRKPVREVRAACPARAPSAPGGPPARPPPPTSSSSQNTFDHVWEGLNPMCKTCSQLTKRLSLWAPSRRPHAQGRSSRAARPRSPRLRVLPACSSSWGLPELSPCCLTRPLLSTGAST